MKVYQHIDDYIPEGKAVVTTGTFDGVHHGHLSILRQLTESARSIGGKSVVITFFPHPRLVLYPDDNDLKLLNTLEEKRQLLEKAGVDVLIVQPFDKEFSRLTSLEFVRNILVNKLNSERLVIGYDHRFGRNREGSFEHLKEYGPVYGFDVEEISRQKLENVTVSSTKIRNALSEGNVELANNLLGYEYPLSGKVKKGDQLGRQLGFPTANIKIEEGYKLVPADGVYAVKTLVNNELFYGMMNIGYRPTINGKQRNLEVNLFHFNKDIYETTITVQFVSRLRSEQKFPSLDLLKKQLFEDREQAFEVFNLGE